MKRRTLPGGSGSEHLQHRLYDLESDNLTHLEE